MGAWGHGLIDNDSAMDFVGIFAQGVQNDIIAIGEADSKQAAGHLCAAIGILFRLSSGCFDPIPGLSGKPHFYPRLLGVVSHNIEHTIVFPGNTSKLLAAVLYGKGEELANRNARLGENITACLFGTEFREKQSVFSVLENDLFEHSCSKLYMSAKTNDLANQIATALQDREEVINMSYSFMGGMIGLLLVLPFRGLETSTIEK